jgi:hypothetical protein
MVTATRTRERKLISVPDEHPDTAYTRIPDAEAFGDADFLRAKDLESIATMMIDHYEGQFGHLRKFSIGYAWKRAGGASKGASTLGKTVKGSGLVRYFSQHDFIIWLAADHLREFNEGERGEAQIPATFWQVEALLYHELMHAEANEKEEPVYKGHDFEGFTKEITEYGAWDTSAKTMRIAFKQLEMDFD